MQLPQKRDYFGIPEESHSKEDQDKLKLSVEQTKRKLTNFGKSVRELPNMVVSFHTRARAMEACFGEVSQEEANIAASILRSILSLNCDIRILVC